MSDAKYYSLRGEHLLNLSFDIHKRKQKMKHLIKLLHLALVLRTVISI